ncbi:hypothetical protein JCM19233_6061 [Vibrio astriarenae]|nr:hypothetical protein JCM19233_6061 [Vibrio sp. C7]
MQLDKDFLEESVDRLVELADKAREGDKDARLKCRVLIKAVCLGIQVKLRGDDKKSNPLVKVEFVTGSLFEFSVDLKTGGLSVISNSSTSNKLQAMLIADEKYISNEYRCF